VTRLGLGAFLAGAALVLACLGVSAEETISGGDGLLYMGARPGQVLIVDEASFKTVGEIPLPRTAPGLPHLVLTEDHKRFYAYCSNLEDVEVVDIASRKVVDAFHLSEANHKVRLRRGAPDAQNRRLALWTRTATKLLDRFETSPATIVEYDLAEHKVARTIPWPKGEELEGVGLRYSSDGKLLYLFADDVFIYDATDLKVVDKWELSRPIEDGFGRIEFDPYEDPNEEPGFFTGLFAVDDPLQHRKLIGVGRMELAAKKLDFWTVGPARDLGDFALAPGRKSAYGLLDEIGNYEIWTFDLEHRRLEKRTPIPGRPRMELAVSSNGKVLYIHGAGDTIDLYDAGTHRYLRTVTLEAEVRGLYVLPKPR
jgi:hypothetical protein